MSTVAKGRGPGLQADRELSIIRVDQKLGILISIHPAGNPDGGWAMWIKPNELATFVREALTTHEPEVPENWPDGHVGVDLTEDEAEECMRVRIHGHTHHLHSTTARELQKMLDERLDEWNKIARAHGMPAV